MIDVRPVAYVIGLMVVILGLSMLVPMAVALWMNSGDASAFLGAALVSVLIGGLVAVASSNSVGQRLTIQQTFLLTTGVWVALPIFGAIPFAFGPQEARFVDAFFEAMSGLTTTGSTAFYNLEALPEGILLWRAMLQWFGGIGIIVVAMVFLPELKVGGMQIFRSEAFDTMGKILPRAAEIASSISVIYLGLTGLCVLAYLGFGMRFFDALCHAMTTISTGGFATSDASFGRFGPGVQYTATVFMILAALPFVRFVQLIGGHPEPLWKDSQIRVFLGLAAVLVFVLALILMQGEHGVSERAIREALFNVVSIMTGTGYASADYMGWGTVAIALFFFIGLIGGCAGSTSCSIKVFRYQLLFSSIKAQIRQIHSPHGLFAPRYAGRKVGDDVLYSVMAFFLLFVLTLGVVAVLLGATGLDFITAVSGAATALANVGPGLGEQIGPAGNFAALNDTAKWILIAAMLIGRLELMAVYVLFTFAFWRS